MHAATWMKLRIALFARTSPKHGTPASVAATPKQGLEVSAMYKVEADQQKLGTLAEISILYLHAMYQKQQ